MFIKAGQEYKGTRFQHISPPANFAKPVSQESPSVAEQWDTYSEALQEQQTEINRYTFAKPTQG